MIGRARGLGRKLAPERLARDRYLLLTQVVNLGSRLVGDDRLSGRLRRRLLRAYGWQIGAGTQIDSPGHIYGQVVVGAGCYVNRDCHFVGTLLITMGDRVAVGPGVYFITSTHRIGPHAQRAGALTAAPIRVGDGAWIGARAILLPGVTVGAGAIVAAGAVVTRDVPADVLVAGVPAQVKRSLD
jgi:acetyltransferase-like isoleucine patch superfamily enzyme